MAVIKIVPMVKKYVDNGEIVNFKKLSVDNMLSSFENEVLKDYLDINSCNKIIFKEELSIVEGAYFINVYQDSNYSIQTMKYAGWISAIITVLVLWHRSGMKQSPDEMQDLIFGMFHLKGSKYDV